MELQIVSGTEWGQASVCKRQRKSQEEGREGHGEHVGRLQVASSQLQGHRLGGSMPLQQQQQPAHTRLPSTSPPVAVVWCAEDCDDILLVAPVVALHHLWKMVATRNEFG
jgi:hypothetical protein